MTNRKESRHRARDIDGLRALAVLAVVAYHVGVYAPWERLVSPALVAAFRDYSRSPLTLGSHGVDLFFILSGFCLSYPALARRHAGETVRFDVARYLARRVVRVYPPFVCAAALCVALSYALLQAGIALPYCLSPDLSAANIVQNLLFLDNNISRLNTSFWTLALEFRWYLVFPLALALYCRAPRALVACALAAYAAYHFTAFRALDLAMLPLFLFGIVAADLRVRGVRTLKFAVGAIVVGAVVGTLATQAYGPFTQRNPGWHLAAFGLVLLANDLTALRKVLSIAPLVLVGEISYSVYLVHEPAIALFERWEPTAVPAALPVLLAPLVALALGVAFWFAIERHWNGTPLATKSVESLARPLRRALRRVQISDEIPIALRTHERLSSEAVESRAIATVGRAMSEVKFR
jgi:peptidoglycan/LPS O-acetylase OafA/YrhL